jgi:hypothetical protein
VYLNDGFTATGEVRLVGAQISKQLACNGATLTNPGGIALNAAGTTITGAVFLHDGFTATGVVDFTNATASALEDREADWPDALAVTGFRYDTLRSDARGWRSRRGWLRRQVEPDPSAYRQLAAGYRASGDDVDARKTLMERHTALIRRDRPGSWKAHFPGPAGRLWRRLLGLSIGHGYEPWLVLWLVVPLLVGMACWYDRADDRELLVPTASARGVTSSTCTSEYPCVQPFVYALDTLIPVIELGQRSRWTPDISATDDGYLDDGRWLGAATWIMSVLGWVFATLIVAGFSGVIRKE